jgi:hypothetical protein
LISVTGISISGRSQFVAAGKPECAYFAGDPVHQQKTRGQVSRGFSKAISKDAPIWAS